jgi:hypothetical protein
VAFVSSLAFLLCSLWTLCIGRFFMLYQKSSAANTQHPQTAACCFGVEAVSGAAFFTDFYNLLTV